MSLVFIFSEFLKKFREEFGANASLRAFMRCYHRENRASAASDDVGFMGTSGDIL